MVNIVPDRGRLQRGMHLFELTQEFGSVPAYTYTGQFEVGPAINALDSINGLQCIRTGIIGPASMFVIGEYGPVLKEIYRPEPKEKDWQLLL